MKWKQYLLLLLVGLLIIGIAFQKPLATHLKIILFITQQFPQIPVKPLGLVTKQPTHQKVELSSDNGKIVADLFVPKDGDKHGAVIVAMGVRTQQKDKPLILSFADTLTRLGYVTFWPRLETLDKGQFLPEEPETFIESFKYLKNLESVDQERISYVGFSVGSSTVFVATTNDEIADKIHALVFFGGYYNVFDYLLSLVTNVTYLGEEKIAWKAHQEAISHAKDLLKAKKADGILQIFEATTSAQANALLNQAPQDEVEKLKRYSPHEVIDNFKAKIFILHDKSDSFVPYVESIRLDQALEENEDKIFLITDLFEHVQPNRPINLSELFKLYGFLYKVFEAI